MGTPEQGIMRNSIVFFSLFFAAITAKPANPTVEISVYYESLCPDSIRFVNEQLFPSWKKFKNELKVDLKPFGKANFYASGSSWNFTCQHGPEECQGNKVQACILDQVMSNTLEMLQSLYFRFLVPRSLFH